MTGAILPASWTRPGVALVSGTSFGILGEGYIRFSYANSITNIEAAIDRIARFLER